MSHTKDLQNAEPYEGLAILSQTCEPYEGIEILRQLCVAKLSQPCEPYEGLAKLSQTREPYERVTESNSTLDRRKTLGCSTFDKAHNEINLSNPHPQTDAVLEILRQLCVAKLSQPCEPYEGLAKLSQTREPYEGLVKLSQTREPYEGLAKLSQTCKPYAKLSQTREPYERVTESNSTLDRRKTLGCRTFDKTHNEIKLSNPHPQTDAVPVVDHQAETPRQTRTSCAGRCDQPR